MILSQEDKCMLSIRRGTEAISVNLRKNNLKNSPLICADFNADSEEFLATEFHRKDTEKSVLICVNLWLIPPLLSVEAYATALRGLRESADYSFLSL